MDIKLIEAYLQAGFHLIPIPAGKKGPIHDHWNGPHKYTLEQLVAWEGNLGLGHKYSLPPTMAFDVDEKDGTVNYLFKRDLDLFRYLNAPDAVQIISGKPNRAKLIYRMPAWCDWHRTRKVTQDGTTLFEFRSATKGGLTVQDVIPPSIHPDTGQPYRWQGDFTNIPEIPPELLQLWMELTKPREPGTYVHSSAKDSEVLSALKYIDPDLPRDDWLRVGMALHSFHPDAINLFDSWSAKGAKYVGTDIPLVWDSFDDTPDGVTVGTLFKYAKDAGWDGYVVPVAQVFGEPGQATPQAPQGPIVTEGVPTVNIAADLRGELKTLPPFQFGDEQLTRPIEDILLRSMVLSQADQIGIQELVHAHTNWTREQMKAIMRNIKRRHRELLGKGGTLESLRGEYLYIANLHIFYHRTSGEMLKPEAFVALNCHVSEELKEQILGAEGVTKVTGLEFDPAQPEYFERQGASYYNQWHGLRDYGTPGDFQPWMEHVNRLVPELGEREHLLNWMAFTLQQPGIKINHAVVFNGLPGVGKDALFWPVTAAMGEHGRSVQANMLLSDFNDYLTDTKFLIIQEPDLGNHREASRVANNLKSVIASPPDQIWINRKGVPQFPIKNVASIVLLTNEPDPIQITHGDRRYFVLSTPLRVTDDVNQPLPGWREYFDSFWYWMDQGGGWRHVVDYLMHRDISGFNPKAHPMMTVAKQEVIDAGASPIGGLFSTLYIDKVGPLGRDMTTVDQILQWMHTADGIRYLVMHGFDKPPGVRDIGKVLKQYLFSTTAVRRLSTGPKAQQRVHFLREQDRWMQEPSASVDAYLNEWSVI